MRYIILLILLVLPIIAFPRQLRGSVIDEQNQPICYANVILLDSDSIFINGVVTDTLGQFLFSNMPQNAVLLKISYIGCNDYYTSVTNADDLGVIKLSESSVTLADFTVKGHKLYTTISSNGMITNVSNTLLSKAGTATDVLSKLPLVTQTNGVFNVFGCGSPIIYINGKMVNNTVELEQLSSQNIKLVEVISNPGSNYSAETNAVIRIKTIPPKGEGLGASLRNITRVAHFVSNTDNLDLTYRNEGLEIFANGYFNNGKRKYHDESSMTTYDNEVFCQQLDSYTTKKATDIRCKMGVNYQFDENNSLGAYYECGRDKTSSCGTTDTKITSDNQLVDKFYLSHCGKDLTSPSHEANLYYNATWGNMSIDFNLDWVRSKKKKEDLQTETYQVLGSRDVLTNATNKNQLWAENLTLSYKIWKCSIDVGEEYTNSHIEYASQYEGIDMDGGNTTIDEKNIALFAKISQRISIIKAGIGLRFEHTDHAYYYNKNVNTDLSRTYNDCYPFLSLSTKIKNVGLSLNFTSRTRRPSYRQLDGTLHYVNGYSYKSGNPQLKSTNRYAIQLMTQWSYFFAQIAYKHEKNAIFYTTERYKNDPLIKLIIFENVPKYRQFQVVVGSQPTIGCWSPQPTLGILNSIYTTQYLGTQKRFNKPFVFFECDNSFSLPKNWIFNVDLMVQTAGNAQNCYIKASGYVNVDVSKSFFNNDLTIKFSANDIFDTNNERIVMYNGDIKVSANNYQESRNVNMSVRYTFNTSRSKYKGSGAGNDEKNRL